MIVSDHNLIFFLILLIFFYKYLFRARSVFSDLTYTQTHQFLGKDGISNKRNHKFADAKFQELCWCWWWDSQFRNPNLARNKSICIRLVLIRPALPSQFALRFSKFGRTYTCGYQILNLTLIWVLKITETYR